MKRISLLLLLVVLASGSVWAQNKVLSLDGDMDWLSLPDLGSLNDVTIEMWVNAERKDQWQGLFGDQGWNLGSIHYQYRTGNSLEFALRSTERIFRMIGSFSLNNQDGWHHLAVVYSSTSESTGMYLNGEVGGASEDIHPGIPVNLVNLGVGTTYSSRWFNGYIDDIRVWNVAKTKAEIRSLITTTLTGKETGLVGYWNFDDGTAKDLTLNGHDGELKGDAKIIRTPLSGVVIPDPNLRAALEKALGKNEGDAITKEDLAGLKELKYEGTEGAKISDLTGLEHCTSLTVLDLDWNQISDISAVSNLTKLTQLYLGDNPISDISALSNLTSLTEISFWQCKRITNITPLVDLTLLAYINLDANKLSDITPLSKLTELWSLSLGGTGISDLSPIANLTKIRRLWLHNNQISDIRPLVNLTNLSYLNLDNSYLNLDNNQISDITPLIENTGISGEIRLKGNPLNNTTLSTQILFLQQFSWYS